MVGTVMCLTSTCHVSDIIYGLEVRTIVQTGPPNHEKPEPACLSLAAGNHSLESTIVAICALNNSSR